MAVVPGTYFGNGCNPRSPQGRYLDLVDYLGVDRVQQPIQHDPRRSPQETQDHCGDSQSRNRIDPLPSKARSHTCGDYGKRGQCVCTSMVGVG